MLCVSLNFLLPTPRWQLYAAATQWPAGWREKPWCKKTRSGKHITHDRLLLLHFVIQPPYRPSSPVQSIVSSLPPSRHPTQKELRKWGEARSCKRLNLLMLPFHHMPPCNAKQIVVKLLSPLTRHSGAATVLLSPFACTCV